LRLAVVSPFVDRRHGTERALAEILERLARNYRCQVHLYSERVEDLALADGVMEDLGDAGFIVWHKVPSIPGPHLVKFLGWMCANAFLRWWHGFYRGLSFDVVLSPGVNCLHANIIVVHALFQRLWQLSSDQVAESTPAAGFFRGLHRRVYYGLLMALERRIYSDPRITLAAVSPHTAGLLNQYYKRPDVSVIPNGVDTREFCISVRKAWREACRHRFQFRDTDRVLLLIGNDWRVKGVLTVLEAMAQLPSLPLHFVIVGNDAADSFRDTARRLGILDRCHWELPRREVIEFYAAADVYVSPSQEDSFGLPVAEAMACGLSVITSANAGVSAYIQDGTDGFVMNDPNSSRKLAEIIDSLCHDTTLRERVGQAAASTAQEWTWDRSAAQTWELLQDFAKIRGNRIPPSGGAG
jgi:glycosyltransferase involved in cell wall biosynthesis